MDSFSLASTVWFRAQKFYMLLHVAGIVIGAIYGAFSGGAGDLAGILFLISFFSCGFALVFGLPAWLILGAFMHLAAPLAARARALFPFFLLAGLAATAGALWLVFGAALGGEGDFEELPLPFCALAGVGMVTSVFSLRERIAGLQADLRGDYRNDLLSDLMSTTH